jgi:hypothetical protein
MDLVFLVYRQLLAKQIVSLLVNSIMVLLVRARIYWTELAVPDLLHVRAGIFELLCKGDCSPELLFLA